MSKGEFDYRDLFIKVGSFLIKACLLVLVFQNVHWSVGVVLTLLVIAVSAQRWKDKVTQAVLMTTVMGHNTVLSGILAREGQRLDENIKKKGEMNAQEN